MKKIEYFSDFLEQFETEELKLYCIDMINLMPDYIFRIPSSTSGKYHNATQCQPGGQILHVLMCCRIMNYLLGLEYVQEKTEYPKKRDCLRIAMCLHDACKCGNGSYTVHEHPMIASEWIRTTSPEHDIKQGLKDYIGRLVESHSGQWTTNKRSSVELPKPENNEQFLIHLCDYLSSRNDLDMLFPEEMKLDVRRNALPCTTEYRLPFGKYKDETLADVIKNDKLYLIWLRDMSEIELTEPLKSLLDEIGDET